MDYTNYSQILSDTFIPNFGNNFEEEDDSFASFQNSHANKSHVHDNAVSLEHHRILTEAEISIMSLAATPIPEEAQEQMESIYILEGYPNDGILLDLSDFLQIGIYSLKKWFKDRHARETQPETSLERSLNVTPFPEEVQNQLDSIYILEGYPSEDMLLELSHFLHISLVLVKQWFDHRHTGTHM